jgi:hypothetical protein
MTDRQELETLIAFGVAAGFQLDVLYSPEGYIDAIRVQESGRDAYWSAPIAFAERFRDIRAKARQMVRDRAAAVHAVFINQRPQ